MPIHRLRAMRRRHRVIAVAGSAALLMGVLGTTTGASAATSLNLSASTTTLTATLSNDGFTFTVTAQVQLGTQKNGFGITPSGTVAITDNLGDHIGTLTVPSCFNTPCVMTHTYGVDVLGNGVTKLIAKYSGDLILKPSQGTTPFGFDRCDGECEARAATATADVDAHSDSTDGYIVDDLGGPGLPCGVPGAGPVAHVQGYQLTADKSISYMLEGDPAHTYYNWVHHQPGIEGTMYWFCYVSPDPFTAYSQDGVSTVFPHSADSFGFLGPAPQITTGGPYDGDYVGLLAFCDSEVFVGDSYYTVGAPCLDDFSSYFNPDSGGYDFYVDIDAPPGDPYLGGLKLATPKIGKSL
ncbi:MAG TPA: hypothetical protein VHE56_04960 [Mycobacteriales bacterium]|nr:hypothetical protein [Mycobacteriales bacterium]